MGGTRDPGADSHRPDAPAAGFQSSILADDSGRRRRRLRWVGRALTVLFILWLGVLGLGALGLQPVGGLPFVGLLPQRAAPPELPVRVQVAVSRHAVVPLVPSRAVRAPGAAPARPSAPRPTRGRRPPTGATGVRTPGALRPATPKRPETTP
ncbi:MAG: hypothetical protein QOK40_3733, partial [Miltoncostaeaceae bacterium]|nr:hypothetical protein [Miltoncostaeaceae bacterium]